MMEKLLRKLLRNRAIVVFFMVLIAVAGMFCYYIIPKQENPEAVVPPVPLSRAAPSSSPPTAPSAPPTPSTSRAA